VTTDKKLETKKQRNPSLYKRLRMAQVRVLARILILLGESDSLRGLLRAFRTIPVLRSLFGWGLAYRRAYSSFAEAQERANKFISAGHEHDDDVKMHTRLADRIRESDYPVLYYWREIAAMPGVFFDFGGNVGNVLYAYDKALRFSADMKWLVYDIPEIRAAGQLVAKERNESRIVFVDSMECAAQCDIFLASGCLHYFTERLDELLASLPKLPRHVFANRTPVTDGPELITLQDNKTFLVPCKIHNRTKLLEGMERLGYKLKSSWTVHELALQVPLYPESSCRYYSGFYFELQ
jgi:putative methyltransferase (TIGR04325 family)